MIVPLDILTAIILATRLRERDRLEVTSTENHDDVIAWAAAAAQRPGEKWALLNRATPVAMGGARMLWPGVVETWLVASEDLPKHAVELVRSVRDMHTAMAANAGVRRFQTVCLVGYDVGHRFLERLGYVVEGRARGLGKRGEDYDYMARIEGDHR